MALRLTQRKRNRRVGNQAKIHIWGSGFSAIVAGISKRPRMSYFRKGQAFFRTIKLTVNCDNIMYMSAASLTAKRLIRDLSTYRLVQNDLRYMYSVSYEGKNFITANSQLNH